MRTITYRDALREAIREEMQRDERVFIMGEDIAGAFPTDVHGKPISEIPLMKGVHDLRQVKVVFTAATGIIGEWWITQVHPQVGIPVIIGPTAVGAPKYYAYLNSGQLVGMVGGMKGAAEYESLLRARYPQLATFYTTTRNQPRNVFSGS